MHLLPLASRCLCFIHPPLQGPPEWENLGTKPMDGKWPLLLLPTSHYLSPSPLLTWPLDLWH
jgi:hypothetical protein